MTDDKYKYTAQLLINNYGLSTRFVNILADERGMSNLLDILNRSLSTYDKLELMLRVEGSDFFAGSKDSTKELRKKIIDCWTDNVRDDEFQPGQGLSWRTRG